MAVDNATGLRSMEDPPDTIPSASTTCHPQTATARAEAAALLNWAEEMLLGQWESCWSCLAYGYIPGGCDSCHGDGHTVRQLYIEAERALTPEQCQELVVSGVTLIERGSLFNTETFRLSEGEDGNS